MLWELRTFVVVVCFNLITVSLSQAASVDIRPWPYPHHHAFTIISDTDGQASWYGDAWRGELSERLGLPIGDSLFPYTPQTGEITDSFFVGDNGLNRRISNADGHAAFIHLLRRWHRHDIDHFHSFMSDSVPIMRFAFDPGVEVLNGVSATPSARSLEAMSVEAARHRIILEFDKVPPHDLGIVISYSDETTRYYDADTVARGRAIKDRPEASVFIELDASAKEVESGGGWEANLCDRIPVGCLRTRVQHSIAVGCA